MLQMAYIYHRLGLGGLPFGTRAVQSAIFLNLHFEDADYESLLLDKYYSSFPSARQRKLTLESVFQLTVTVTMSQTGSHKPFIDAQTLDDYQRLCLMSFQEVHDMAKQIQTEDGDNHFDYAGALEEICKRIQDFNEIRLATQNTSMSLTDNESLIVMKNSIMKTIRMVIPCSKDLATRKRRRRRRQRRQKN